MAKNTEPKKGNKSNDEPRYEFNSKGEIVARAPMTNDEKRDNFYLSGGATEAPSSPNKPNKPNPAPSRSSSSNSAQAKPSGNVFSNLGMKNPGQGQYSTNRNSSKETTPSTSRSANAALSSGGARVNGPSNPGNAAEAYFSGGEKSNASSPQGIKPDGTGTVFKNEARLASRYDRKAERLEKTTGKLDRYSTKVNGQKNGADAAEQMKMKSLSDRKQRLTERTNKLRDKQEQSKKLNAAKQEKKNASQNVRNARKGK